MNFKSSYYSELGFSILRMSKKVFFVWQSDLMKDLLGRKWSWQQRGHNKEIQYLDVWLVLECEKYKSDGRYLIDRQLDVFITHGYKYKF